MIQLEKPSGMHLCFVNLDYLVLIKALPLHQMWKIQMLACLPLGEALQTICLVEKVCQLGIYIQFLCDHISALKLF